MNEVYNKLRTKLNELSFETTDKLKKRFTRQSDPDKWDVLKGEAKSWHSLMSDGRYPIGKRFLDKVKCILQANMQIVLMCNTPKYSREERVDKAAIIAGQVQLLEYLMNDPERAVDMVKDEQPK